MCIMIRASAEHTTLRHNPLSSVWSNRWKFSLVSRAQRCTTCPCVCAQPHNHNLPPRRFDWLFSSVMTRACNPSVTLSLSVSCKMANVRVWCNFAVCPSMKLLTLKLSHWFSCAHLAAGTALIVQLLKILFTLFQVYVFGYLCLYW